MKGIIGIIFLCATCVVTGEARRHHANDGDTPMRTVNVDRNVQDSMCGMNLLDDAQFSQAESNNMEELLGFVRKHEVQEIPDYLKPVIHKIHSNGTGHLNGSGIIGIWDQHGASDWIIGHNEAFLYQYMIKKAEFQNNTVLIVGHVAANITGEKNIVKWITKSYSTLKLQLANGSLVTLSNTVSDGKGQFIATTKRSGVYQEETESTVNNTHPPMIIKMDSKNSGVAKADSRRSKWAGTVEGRNYLEDGMNTMEYNPQIIIPFKTKIQRPSQLYDPSANWTVHYSGFMDKRHKIGKYYTSASETINAAGSLNNISIEAKGLFWEDDHHSFKMNMHEVFNKWLPIILDFIL